MEAHPRDPEVPLQVRMQERGDEPARRAVHVHRDVAALLGLQPVQGPADLQHGLVAAVHGGAQDGDHADGVLVALGRGLGRAQVQPPRHHRHVARLHLPVAAELLPAHLDVRAHDQVRLGRVQPGRLPPGPPPPQHRHPAEHAGLARPGGRAAGRLAACRGVPQVGEDVHAAPLELGGLRVLVLVDHVLGGALGHQQLGLRLHPGGDERGQVEPGVAVEDELVPDDLQRGARQDPVLRQLVPGDLAALLAEVDGVDLEFGVPGGLVHLGVQRHGRLPGCAVRRRLGPSVARLTCRSGELRSRSDAAVRTGWGPPNGGCRACRRLACCAAAPAGDHGRAADPRDGAARRCW